MNVEIGTEAAQFPKREYINGIFVAVQKRILRYMWRNCPCSSKMLKLTGMPWTFPDPELKHQFFASCNLYKNLRVVMIAIEGLLICSAFLVGVHFCARGAPRHIIDMVWLNRLPISVGRKLGILLVQITATCLRGA
jgi:hypothetical protein